MNKENLKKKILSIIQTINKFDIVFWSDTIFPNGQYVYIKENEETILHIKYGALGNRELFIQAKKNIEELFKKEKYATTVDVFSDSEREGILWLEIIEK